jgi:oxygen-independent coproporphyrinogen-3 oxidase
MTENISLISPPLSLYIHIPWCVQKCPYCDFNSHALKHDIPEQAYIDALLTDLDADLAKFQLNRPLHSIFIGGGTPSLLSVSAMKKLLTGVFSRFTIAENLEVTMEANPGTVEAEKFYGFAEAGINRLSIGVQSFAGEQLLTLGRIHNSEQAINAIKLAKQCGVNSVNIDLMHGLPKQQVDHALNDLKQAIALEPDHISWYQLTIEPNTAFFSKPPTLPDDDELWEIQQQGQTLLAVSGYQQYEVSAYAKAHKQCQHNLNYWKFGDYLGIGCGAHGKITDTASNQIYRTVKVKHPKGYLTPNRAALDQLTTVDTSDRTFEFMMNQLRLLDSFTLNHYEQTTGIHRQHLLPLLATAQQRQLMQPLNVEATRWQVTALGHRYLNDLLALFL